MLEALTDTTALDAEAAALGSECEVVAELTRKAVEENARAALDQNEYNARYNALIARFEAADARLAELEAERVERRRKRANIKHRLSFISATARQWKQRLKIAKSRRFRGKSAAHFGIVRAV